MKIIRFEHVIRIAILAGFLGLLFGSPGYAQTESKENLDRVHVSLPIKPEVFAKADAATSNVKVLGFVFRVKPEKTRLMVVIQFKSRNLAGAQYNLKLKDSSGKVLATHECFEKVGPVEARRPGHNLDYVRPWDTTRDYWIDFPKEVEKATTVEFELVERPGSPE